MTVLCEPPVEGNSVSVFEAWDGRSGGAHRGSSGMGSISRSGGACAVRPFRNARRSSLLTYTSSDKTPPPQ
jgi:hypothetical protein